MMMLLLWILSAQPLIFAIIFAVRGYRQSTAAKTRRQINYHPSLPVHHGGSGNPIVAK
jgi:hypothetical protein